ncbi:MAG: hypothetical protein IPK21_21180 [Haliscomenobacter sp.]|nr:hypothetical protein [Haliscomenobacter sp.]
MQDFSRASHLAAAGQPLQAHNFLVTEKGMVAHNNGCMAAALGDDPLLCLKKRLKDPNLGG